MTKTKLPTIFLRGTLLVSLGIVGCSSGSSPVSTGSGGSSGFGGSGGRTAQSGGSVGSGGTANGGASGSPGFGGRTGVGGTGGADNSTGGSTQMMTGGTVTDAAPSSTDGNRSGGATGSNGGSNATGGMNNGGAAGEGGGTAGTRGFGGSGIGGTDAGADARGTGGADGGNGGNGGANTSDAGVATDVSPAVYNPCPTDGSDCVILPLGDSITLGYSDDGLQDKIGGYRGQLFHDAQADHKKITFVGPCSNGPATIDGVPFPAKHAGFFAQTINSIANLMMGGSGGSMYCPSGSLFAFNIIPHIVLLHAGTNNRDDSSTQMTQDAADLGSLIDKVVGKAPKASIFVAQLIPVGDNGSADAFVVKFNDLIATTVVPPRQSAGKHVYLVDQHTSFDPTTMFPAKTNPIHPNQAGYNHMGDVWYSAIKPALP